MIGGFASRVFVSMSGALCDSIKSVQVMLRVAPRHSKLFFLGRPVSRLARRSFLSPSCGSRYVNMVAHRSDDIYGLNYMYLQKFPGARSMFVKETENCRKKRKENKKYGAVASWKWICESVSRAAQRHWCSSCVITAVQLVSFLQMSMRLLL